MLEINKLELYYELGLEGEDRLTYTKNFLDLVFHLNHSYREVVEKYGYVENGVFIKLIKNNVEIDISPYYSNDFLVRIEVEGKDVYDVFYDDDMLKDFYSHELFLLLKKYGFME